MMGDTRRDDGTSPPELAQRIDEACDRFEADWLGGKRPRIEEFLGSVPEAGRGGLLRHLLALELAYREVHGEYPAVDEYRARFPDAEATLAAVFGPAPAAPPREASRGGPRGTGNADRNLLFGILALQNNFIDRTALLAAFNAWVADKSRPLGRVLVAQGTLDEGQHGLLEALVREHFRRHGDDPERSLADPGSAGSAQRDLETLADPHVSLSLGQVAGAQAHAADPEVTAHFQGSSRHLGPRFRVLRLHAKGGLGQVSVALDDELHREVAIKEIRPHLVNEPESRARFVQEAEVTGGLEHPGIVPVYSLGHDACGRPFYAMRFVRGDSLKEAIARFHNDDAAKRDPGHRSLELQKLLRRFLDVCNAIEYAHSRGVLHRDIKPANVIVGKHGETLVVDWGLAKVTGRPDPDSGERTLSPSSSSGSTETLPGSALGTPAYMSPEQAAGELDRLGPRSDVYSLGATLYNMLAGQAPFDGDAGSVLRAVQRGDARPLRALDPSIDAGLEAVCLKAMSTRAGDRYPTPRALADDLERWLADEPVSALPESLFDRAARWARRHRSWMTAGAAAISLISVVSIVSAVIIARQRDREVHLRAEAVKERAGALRSSARLAEDLASTLCLQGEVGRGTLTYVRALELAERAEDRALIDLIRRDLTGWRAGLAQLEAMLPHEGDVTVVAASPDGKTILTASADNTARLWESRTGRPIGEVMRHDGRIAAARFSGDGSYVLTGSYDFTARMWDAKTGRPAGPPLRSNFFVLAVDLSHDGRLAATGSADRTVRLWEPVTGRMIGRAMAHQEMVTAVALSPDCKTIVSGGGDKLARRWDARTTRAIDPPMKHGDRLTTVRFSPDGKFILTASWDKTARIWDAATGRPSTPPMEHEGSVNRATFSSDGAFVATGGEDGFGRLWDTSNGRPLGIPMWQGGSVLDLALGPDGRSMVTASANNKAGLWDTNNCAPTGGRLTHGGLVLCVAFGPNGETFITGSQDRTARVWTAPERVPPGVNIDDDGKVVAIESQTGWAMVVRSDNSARVWEMRSGRPVSPMLPHPARLKGASLSRSGRLAVTLDESGVTRLWELPSGRLVGTAGSGSAATCIAVSPDAQLIATGGADGVVRLWDVAGKEVAGPLLKHDDDVLAVEFSDDSRFVVSGSTDSTARMWDVRDRRMIGPPMRHGAWVSAVAFDHDARKVATGGTDAMVRVWDPKTGRPIIEPFEHVSGIRRVGLGPDGRTLFASCANRTLSLWDMETHRPLGPPVLHVSDHVSSYEPSGLAVWVALAEQTPRGRQRLGFVRWSIPSPMQEDVQELRRWAERATGLKLVGTETFELLDIETWRALRTRIR